MASTERSRSGGGNRPILAWWREHRIVVEGDATTIYPPPMRALPSVGAWLLALVIGPASALPTGWAIAAGFAVVGSIPAWLVTRPWLRFTPTELRAGAIWPQIVRWEDVWAVQLPRRLSLDSYLVQLIVPGRTPVRIHPAGITRFPLGDEAEVLSIVRAHVSPEAYARGHEG